MLDVKLSKMPNIEYNRSRANCYNNHFLIILQQTFINKYVLHLKAIHRKKLRVDTALGRIRQLSKHDLLGTVTHIHIR